MGGRITASLRGGTTLCPALLEAVPPNGKSSSGISCVWPVTYRFADVEKLSGRTFFRRWASLVSVLPSSLDTVICVPCTRVTW